MGPRYCLIWATKLQTGMSVEVRWFYHAQTTVRSCRQILQTNYVGGPDSPNFFLLRYILLSLQNSPAAMLSVAKIEKVSELLGLPVLCQATTPLLLFSNVSGSLMTSF